jgi:hypothetical protein
MLANEPPNIEGARETAQRIIRDCKRASEVIARLRALFIKNEATTEAVNLNEVTREVIALSLSDEPASIPRSFDANGWFFSLSCLDE